MGSQVYISLFIVRGLFFSFNPIKKVVPKRIVQAILLGIWASFKGRFDVKFSILSYFYVTQTFTTFKRWPSDEEYLEF